MNYKKIIFIVMVMMAAIFPPGASGDNIDPGNIGSKYVWGENVGWLNFKPSQGPGVTVGDAGLSGYIWGENIGWISLSCLDAGTCATAIYGVQNDGNGNISGYAWGENVGWINFAPTGGGVSINACGEFNGYAWGENIGWINFRSDGANPFKLITAWQSPIDNIPPVTTYSPSVLPWYKTDAVFNFFATDCGKGTKEVRYRINSDTEVITAGTTASATVTPEGCNMLEYYSIDLANNVEPSRTLSICIDKMSPTVSISVPANGSTYNINQSLFANFTVTELLSGIASVTSTLPMGSAINTAATGTYTFNVTATDKAGNTAPVTSSYSIIFPGNMDPGSASCKYVWAENVGWINFEPSWGPGVTVSNTAVTGKAWGENIGWINLSPTNGGVVNDGKGNLSGYAWGENVGWINFKPANGGVIIGSDGKFTGYAWGENIGWINFSASNSCVKTAWVVPLIDDGNPCTIDAIDPITGNVTHTPVADGTSCADADHCNGEETCKAGVCTAGTAVVCAPPATCRAAGVCNTSTGVCDYANLADGTACNDGNACTTGDKCSNGNCGGTAVVCTPPETCHAAGVCNTSTGACDYAVLADGTSCDDGNKCTIGDVCTNGVCAGVQIICNDNNVCTGPDHCDPATGLCVFPLLTGTACDDGKWCTVNDTCSNGICVGQARDCSDGIACTDDSCDEAHGKCMHTPNNSLCPSDGLFCNGTESCDATLGCVHTGNPCNPTTQHCVENGSGTGTCVNNPCTPPAAGACNDNNVCTDDSYDPNGPPGVCPCVHTNNTAACNDNLFCNGADTCSNGTCSVHGGNPCKAGTTCNEATDHCDPITDCTGYPAGTQCDDKNACTTNDKCVKILTKMVCIGTPVANGTSCGDGNLCTTGDACYFGFCLGKPKNCNDNNPCTIDFCDPATGSCKNVAKPNGTACEDGNLCTVNDTCQSGTCTAGTTRVCDDRNPCTTDTCDPKSGCKYTKAADGTACEDGNLCTVNDVCDDGICKGKPKNCSDGNPCTMDSCDRATGNCVHTFNKPKSVTILGDQPYPETATQNKQIQTLFTVTNGGCIVSSGPNYVYVSTGSIVDFNWKVGVGPNPTTVKLDNVAYTPIPDHGSVTCSDAVTAHTIYLDNLKATGGKDKDTITVKGSAAD